MNQYSDYDIRELPFGSVFKDYNSGNKMAIATTMVSTAYPNPDVRHSWSLPSQPAPCWKRGGGHPGNLYRRAPSRRIVVVSTRSHEAIWLHASCVAPVSAQSNQPLRRWPPVEAWRWWHSRSGQLGLPQSVVRPLRLTQRQRGWIRPHSSSCWTRWVATVGKTSGAWWRIPACRVAEPCAALAGYDPHSAI